VRKQVAGRGFWAAALFVVASAVWIGLWVWTNPPGAAPDEPGHYVKAVAAGRGELRGAPVSERALAAGGAFTPANLRQVTHAFRSFAVPEKVFVITGPPCTAFRAHLSARCLAGQPPRAARRSAGTAPASSIVGGYPPWVYLPGGLLARAAGSPAVGYRLVRLGSALVAVGLIAAAAALARPGPGQPAVLAALAVAITPMVLFLSSEAGSNGPEVAGAVAVGAAGARLSGRERPGRAVWWLAGVSAAVAAAARPLAPLWVALAALLALARLGPGPAWRRLRDGGRPATMAVALAVAGALADVIWIGLMHMRAPVLWGDLAHNARTAAGFLPAVARQAVGVFGWQDTFIPGGEYVVWWALAAALVAVALAVGSRRDTWVLLGGIVVVAAVYEVVAAAVFVQNGFGMQGRYILPALAVLVLFAGDVIGAAAPGPPALARGLPVAAGVVLAVTSVGQLVAWGANAHRYAVGAGGPTWFLPVAAWAPRGGWPLAVAVATAAAAIGLAAAVAVAVRPPRPGAPARPVLASAVLPSGS
jgi:hypothetical protein